MCVAGKFCLRGFACTLSMRLVIDLFSIEEEVSLSIKQTMAASRFSSDVIEMFYGPMKKLNYYSYQMLLLTR